MTMTMTMTMTQWQFWAKRVFLPDEAARELDDLFADSKLWERAPFESELEAVWVWVRTIFWDNLGEKYYLYIGFSGEFLIDQCVFSPGRGRQSWHSEAHTSRSPLANTHSCPCPAQQKIWNWSSWWWHYYRTNDCMAMGRSPELYKHASTGRRLLVGVGLSLACAASSGRPWWRSPWRGWWRGRWWRWRRGSRPCPPACSASRWGEELWALDDVLHWTSNHQRSLVWWIEKFK